MHCAQAGQQKSFHQHNQKSNTQSGLNFSMQSFSAPVAQVFLGTYLHSLQAVD